MSGDTKAAADAVADGATAAGAKVDLKAAADAQPADLLACDAVVLGSYDALSYMGGALQFFLDRAFYPTQGQVTDKPYAAFVTHGGGGTAIASIESLGQSFKLRKVAAPVLVQGRPDTLPMAVVHAKDGPKARIAAHEPIELVIPGDPRHDRHRALDLNDHIINFLNHCRHKHPRVQPWVKRHPRFHMHFIPTSSSWLNLVARWFRSITDQRIRRGGGVQERGAADRNC